MMISVFDGLCSHATSTNQGSVKPVKADPPTPRMEQDSSDAHGAFLPSSVSVSAKTPESFLGHRPSSNGMFNGNDHCPGATHSSASGKRFANGPK